MPWPRLLPTGMLIVILSFESEGGVIALAVHPGLSSRLMFASLVDAPLRRLYCRSLKTEDTFSHSSEHALSEERG